MIIIDWIKHLWRVHHSERREMLKRTGGEGGRSSKWPAVEKAHIAAYPTCAGCGGKKKLQVHHEKPFHSHPELELEPSNLITLCMGKYECHIRIGHGDNFHYYNPNVVADAREVLRYPERRAAIEASAKAGRLVNEPGGS